MKLEPAHLTVAFLTMLSLTLLALRLHAARLIHAVVGIFVLPIAFAALADTTTAQATIALKEQFPEYSFASLVVVPLTNKQISYIAALASNKQSGEGTLTLFRYSGEELQAVEQSVDLVLQGKQSDSLSLEDHSLVFTRKTSACCDQTYDRYYFRITELGLLLYANRLEYIKYGISRNETIEKIECHNDFVSGTGFIEVTTKNVTVERRYTLPVTKLLPLREFDPSGLYETNWPRAYYTCHNEQ